MGTSEAAICSGTVIPVWLLSTGRTPAPGIRGSTSGNSGCKWHFSTGQKRHSTSLPDGNSNPAGRPASDTPYWDIVAALNTPVILHGWPGFDTDGSVLPVTAVTARRDEFLSTALNQL